MAACRAPGRGGRALARGVSRGCSAMPRGCARHRTRWAGRATSTFPSCALRPRSAMQRPRSARRHTASARPAISSTSTRNASRDCVAAPPRSPAPRRSSTARRARPETMPRACRGIARRVIARRSSVTADAAGQSIAPSPSAPPSDVTASCASTWEGMSQVPWPSSR